MRGQLPADNALFNVVDMFKFDVIPGNCGKPIIDDITIKFCNVYLTAHKDVFYHVPTSHHIIMQCGTLETGVRYCYQINGTRYFFPSIAPHIIACHRDKVSKRDIDIISQWPYGQFDYVNNSIIRYEYSTKHDEMFWRNDGKSKGTYNPTSIPLVPNSPPVFHPVKKRQRTEFKPVQHLTMSFTMMLGTTTGQTREFVSSLILSGNQANAEVYFNNQKMMITIRYKGFGFEYWGSDNQWHSFQPVFLIDK